MWESIPNEKIFEPTLEDTCQRMSLDLRNVIWTQAMCFTNGEFVESSHYSFKKEERTHGFKVKTFIGTPKHYKATIKKQQSLQLSLF